uniref:NPYR-1 n=1 Tax=Schmidtea mediterranea TaxID=79327 RepID=A0A193KUW5_SCHMD|nr:NPYR-1 [Schmidtea mediterranea]
MDLCKDNPKSYQLIVSFVNKCLNESFRQAYLEILQDEMIRGRNMGKFSLSFLIPLVLSYIAMIVIGTLGSSLVIYVVLRSKTLRTPRNMFILNLAITDLILCAFSQPFNIIRLLSFHKEWIFGEWVCKLVGLFTGTNVCVSTISITAIALDRYQVILCPTRNSLQLIGAIKVMLGIWILSLIIASPLVLFSGVETVNMLKANHTRCTEHTVEIYMRKLKVGYSIATLVLLYVIPLSIVTITYMKIYRIIKQRMNNLHKKDLESSNSLPNSHKMELLTDKQKYDIQRQRRANILLLSITIVFAISWLPLNLINMIMDLYLMYNESTVGPMSLRIQSICLLMVLTSACTNPILYGWLNDNFRHEFKRFFQNFHYKSEVSSS